MFQQLGWRLTRRARLMGAAKHHCWWLCRRMRKRDEGKQNPLLMKTSTTVSWGDVAIRTGFVAWMSCSDKHGEIDRCTQHQLGELKRLCQWTHYNLPPVGMEKPWRRCTAIQMSRSDLKKSANTPRLALFVGWICLRADLCHLLVFPCII